MNTHAVRELPSFGLAPELVRQKQIEYAGCDRCTYGYLPSGEICTCKVGQMLRRRAQREQAQEENARLARADARQEDLNRQYGEVIPAAYIGITWESIIETGGAETEKLAGIKQAIQYVKTGQLPNGKGKLCNSLFIHGTPGAMKTTLAMRIAQDCLAQGVNVMALPLYHFLRQLGAMEYDQAETAILQASEVPFLIIDDLGKPGAKREETERRCEIVFAVIDYRCSHRLPTVITSNVDLDAIAFQFGNPTASRLNQMAASVWMGGKDLRR